MATLNGAEFRILTIEWATYQNNIVQNIIGSDTVVVQSQGYKTDPIKIRGMVQNKKELDTFQEQFYSGGALTFIKSINSGEQYQVYALGNIRSEDPSNNENDQGIIFNCLIHLKYPYKESTVITTRSKTITTQNQEWSTDNDGNPLKTEGNVNAVPDIQITGGAKARSILQTTSDSNYNMSASGASVTITQAVVSHSGGVTPTAVFGQTINCRKAGMAIIDSIQVTVQNISTAGNMVCTVYDSISGTSLGSKTINITTTGDKTFVFSTPITVIQNENTCADSTDSKKIYIEFSCAVANINLQYKDTNVYADGAAYYNGTPYGWDLKFVLSGHSCKEIRQTFKVGEVTKLSKTTLNMCKYQYTGSNPITVTIKEGSTTLGTGTTVLSGTTFAEFVFILSDETSESLILSTGTTYILVITPPSDSGNATDVLIKMNTTSVYVDGSVTLVEDGDTTRVQITHDIYFKLYGYSKCDSPQIYNTNDTTIKAAVANDIIYTAIHRINTDNTGTINFDDDFTTDKWIYTQAASTGVTHDEGNDELDIADDGYIYWKKDTKFPINGIPTLTSRINITSGIPTIQISEDASTWYNIDTAIVDDAETVYPLDSDGNLSLAGKTGFYWRIDCVKAAVATCSIKYFELDINIHTIYAKNPKITKGSSASTFRIDQDPDSGMDCIVDLIYQDRWWI